MQVCPSPGGGQITEISNIQQVDQQSQVNVPQADNALSLMQNENLDGDGVAHTAPQYAHDGRRLSDKVRIRSVSVGIRCEVEAVPPEDTPSSYDGAWVHYGIYSVRSENNTIVGEAGWPQPAELMPMPRFGYQSSDGLDAQEDNITAQIKKRTILRGKVFMPFRKDRCNVKFVEKHKLWSELLQYGPLSQNGQNCLKSKLFFVVRSDIPNHLNYTDYHANIIAYTKLRYYDG